MSLYGPKCAVSGCNEEVIYWAVVGPLCSAHWMRVIEVFPSLCPNCRSRFKLATANCCSVCKCKMGCGYVGKAHWKGFCFNHQPCRKKPCQLEYCYWHVKKRTLLTCLMTIGAAGPNIELILEHCKDLFDYL